MAIAKADRVALAPLRARFQYLEDTYGMTAADIARELGWTRIKGKRSAVDDSRVKRALGLAAHHRAGNPYVQQFTSYEQAVRLCRALDMDPYEAGI